MVFRYPSPNPGIKKETYSTPNYFAVGSQATLGPGVFSPFRKIGEESDGI